MIPSAETQLLFLQKIQLLLEEGSFSSTYKYALLLALSDLSIEKGVEDGAELTLSTQDLARKFIQYYWRQSLPYHSYEGEHGILKQNTGPQAAVINKLVQYQQAHHSPLRYAINDTKLISEIATTVKNMPLWRLQNFSQGVDDFLYEQIEMGNIITLREGVAYCFRVFHGQIQNMVQGSWVRWVRSLRKNNTVLGQLADLNEFMFGSERADLSVYVPPLRELQESQCFYCERALPSDTVAVDHFIPWSRYPVDLGHNFVLAHSACNQSKRDLLPAVPHIEKWQERNDKHKVYLHDYFETKNIIHDIASSYAIAAWAYEKTEAIGGDVWMSKEQGTIALDACWRQSLSG